MQSKINFPFDPSRNSTDEFLHSRCEMFSQSRASSLSNIIFAQLYTITLSYRKQHVFTKMPPIRLKSIQTTIGLYCSDPDFSLPKKLLSYIKSYIHQSPIKIILIKNPLFSKRVMYPLFSCVYSYEILQLSLFQALHQVFHS